MNSFVKKINEIEKIKKDFYIYRRTVYWLLHEAYILNKKKFIGIIVSSFIGLGILGVSLSVLFKFVHHLESNEPLKILFFDLPARNDFMLLGVSVLFMVLLIIGAAVLYFAKKRINMLMVDFSLASIKRAAVKFGWEPDNDIAWVKKTKLYAEVKKVYNGDAKKAGMALRRLLNGLQFFLTSFAGLVALLWLDALATLFVFIIIIFALFFYYSINQGAANASRRDDELSSNAGIKTRRLLLSVSTWPNPEFSGDVFSEEVNKGIIRDRIKAQADRLTAQSKSEFVSYVTTAIILSFLLLFMGKNAMTGKISWSLVVAYIVLLNTVMQALKKLFQILTVVSRYYPNISRYYEFFTENVSENSEYKLNKLHLSLDNNVFIEKTGYKFTIKKGDIAGFIVPVDLSRYSVKFISRILSGNKSGGDLISSISIAVPITKIQVPVSLRILLGLPAEWDKERIIACLGQNSSKIKKHISLDPDEMINPNSWDELSHDDLKSISLIAVEASRRPILIIHEKLVSEEWLKDKSQFLSGKMVFIHFKKKPTWTLINRFTNNIVAAVDASIIGCGSGMWLKKTWERITERQEEIYKRIINEARGYTSEINSEEDEDDDDDD